MQVLLSDRAKKFSVPLLVTLPIAVIIGAALWLAVAAAYENIKFSQATDQILALVGMGREAAVKRQDFGLVGGDDLAGKLKGMGLLPDGDIRNPWGGNVTISAPASAQMRVETELPVRNCRRMAQFFGMDAKGLGLLRMEVRDAGRIWRQFYQSTPAPTELSEMVIHATCGRGAWIGFALTFRLH